MAKVRRGAEYTEVAYGDDEWISTPTAIIEMNQREAKQFLNELSGFVDLNSPTWLVRFILDLKELDWSD